MNQPTHAQPEVKRRFKQQFSRLRKSAQHGMLGPAEIVALVTSLLMLVVVAVCYLYLLVPARNRVSDLQQQRSLLQAKLRSSETTIREGQDTSATVGSISTSLVEFESTRLVSRTQGRMGLYGELNELIRKNGLRNSSGPTYTTLDPAGLKPTRGATRTTKWQSVYPGIGVSVTVDGQYQNLRQFMRALEMSRQFIVINAVELEPATNTEKAREEDPTGGPKITLVSLRLDLAIYFQRGAVEEAVPLER